MKSRKQLLEECIEEKQKLLVQLKSKQAGVLSELGTRPVSSFNPQYRVLADLQVYIAEQERDLAVYLAEYQKVCDKTVEEVITGSKEQVLEALSKIENNKEPGDNVTYKLIKIVGGKDDANG